ncbi:hypothetical protein PRIPAC_75972, partial [Pristionchus pacificus]|uniref:Serine/threonine-protein phosphatase n=1 Tax=Pristionchus pacificus TaxID=54126 RepID=A0A2A6C0U1_PRIPA
MGALLSVFLSLFGGTPSAVEAREAGGGEGISDLAAPLTDPAPATAPQATAPQATAPQATAPAATVAPHKAQSAPEPADVRATALKAEAQQTFCGVPEMDGGWQLFEPPPRIKECKVSDADRAKLVEHLDNIFDDESLNGTRVAFLPYDVAYLTSLVIPILESEPMLITDVPMGITVVGDLHGQLHDLHRVFAAEERDGKKGWENMKYLFLGDYVDRGRQSLEILMCLFSLKCLYPDRIFLLRGNHEFITTNSKYGFPTELWDRYEEETARFLYSQLNATFCYLSVCAIVGNQYFCAHGGIALSGMTRRHWKGILKPYLQSQDDVVVHDTIWSDPAGGLRGSTFNVERYTSHYYGLDLLAVALHSMECKLLIRAHSMLNSGYDFLGNLCISIFTATGMKKNNGAIAVIDDNGKVRMSILPIDLERVAWDRKLKRMDANHFEDTTDDEEGTEVDEITVYAHIRVDECILQQISLLLDGRNTNGEYLRRLLLLELLIGDGDRLLEGPGRIGI